MSSDLNIPTPIAQAGISVREVRLRVAAEAASHEEQLTRERHADYQLRQFQQGVSGAGVTLSRIAGWPTTKGYHSISGFLSERRDTQPQVTGEYRAKRQNRVIFFPSAHEGASRWENEGGALSRPVSHRLQANFRATSKELNRVRTTI